MSYLSENIELEPPLGKLTDDEARAKKLAARRALPASLHRQQLLDINRATSFFGGYSPVHWRRLVKAGKVPKPIRIGRKDFWIVGDLLDVVEAAKADGG